MSICRYETLTNDLPNGDVDTSTGNGTAVHEESEDLQMNDISPNSNTLSHLRKVEKSYDSTASTEAVSPKNINTSTSQDNIGLVKTQLLQSNFSFLFQWTTDYPPGTIPFYSLLISTFSVTIIIIMFLYGSKFYYAWWFIIILTIFFAITIFSLFYIIAFNQDSSITTFQVSKVMYNVNMFKLIILSK